MSLWTALAGAGRYAAAVASGDIADAEALRLRVARCRTCPTARIHAVPLTGAWSAFCGPPFVDRTGEEPASCGCLVAWAPAQPTDGDQATIRLRVLAALQPAGKLCVASERCPAGRWESCNQVPNPP